MTWRTFCGWLSRADSFMRWRADPEKFPPPGSDEWPKD